MDNNCGAYRLRYMPEVLGTIMAYCGFSIGAADMAMLVLRGCKEAYEVYAREHTLWRSKRGPYDASMLQLINHVEDTSPLIYHPGLHPHLYHRVVTAYDNIYGNAVSIPFDELPNLKRLVLKHDCDMIPERVTDLTIGDEFKAKLPPLLEKLQCTRSFVYNAFFRVYGGDWGDCIWNSIEASKIFGENISHLTITGYGCKCVLWRGVEYDMDSRSGPIKPTSELYYINAHDVTLDLSEATPSIVCIRDRIGYNTAWHIGDRQLIGTQIIYRGCFNNIFIATKRTKKDGSLLPYVHNDMASFKVAESNRIVADYSGVESNSITEINICVGPYSLVVLLPRDCTNLVYLCAAASNATIVEHSDPARYNGFKYPALDYVYIGNKISPLPVWDF